MRISDWSSDVCSSDLLPFGGEPTVRDYGRMIADAALLLIVATVGILWRTHETSEVPALIAFQALAFYAAARMLDRPFSGAITLGLALAAAFLTRDRKSTRLNSSH